MININKINNQNEDDKKEVQIVKDENHLKIQRDSIMTRDSQVSISEEDKLEKFKTIGRVSKEDDGKIIKDENDEIVTVSLKSYVELVKYCGGWCPVISL